MNAFTNAENNVASLNAALSNENVGDDVIPTEEGSNDASCDTPPATTNEVFEDGAPREQPFEDYDPKNYPPVSPFGGDGAELVYEYIPLEELECLVEGNKPADEPAEFEDEMSRLWRETHLIDDQDPDSAWKMRLYQERVENDRLGIDYEIARVMEDQLMNDAFNGIFHPDDFNYRDAANDF